MITLSFKPHLHVCKIVALFLIAISAIALYAHHVEVPCDLGIFFF